MAKIIGPVPPNCWHTPLCVSAVDIDIDGRVHEASCVRYFEETRFTAAAGGAYRDRNRQTSRLIPREVLYNEPPATDELVLRSHTIRAYVAYVGTAVQGDRLEVFTWAFEPSEPHDGTIHLAFEVQAANGDLLLRGCLVVVPPSVPVAVSPPTSGSNQPVTGPLGS